MASKTFTTSETVDFIVVPFTESPFRTARRSRYDR